MLNKILNYLIVLYAFLIVLNKNIANIILDIILVLFLFSPKLKMKLKILLRNKIFQIFIIFLIYNLIVILWTPDHMYGLYYIKKYLKYSFIFIFALIIEEKYIKYILSSFLFAIFISELTAYGIYFKFWDTYYHSKFINNIHDLSPFMHHTLYTLFLGTGILIILIKLFFENLSIKEKIFLFLFFITMTTNLFMSGGRGGQVAFFLTFIILILYNILKTRQYKYIFILFLPIILFILGYNYSELFYHRIHQAIKDTLNILNHFNFCGSMGQRIGAWIVSFEILKNPIHLFFGIGFKEPIEFLHNLINTPEFNYLKCMDKNYSHTHLHNEYLMQITQTGLIGLILYLSFIYKIIKIDTNSLYLNNIKITFFSMFLIVSLVEPLFTTSWSINLFILFSSIFVFYDIKKSLPS